LKIEFPYNFPIFFLGIYPKVFKAESQRFWIPMFIAALFRIDKDGSNTDACG
jgi:hypothetical protein